MKKLYIPIGVVVKKKWDSLRLSSGFDFHSWNFTSIIDFEFFLNLPFYFLAVYENN